MVGREDYSDPDVLTRKLEDVEYWRLNEMILSTSPSFDSNSGDATGSRSQQLAHDRSIDRSRKRQHSRVASAAVTSSAAVVSVPTSAAAASGGGGSWWRPWEGVLIAPLCLPILKSELHKILSDPHYLAITCRTLLYCELKHPPKIDGACEEMTPFHLWGKVVDGLIMRTTGIAESFKESTLNYMPHKSSDDGVKGSGAFLSRVSHSDMYTHLFDPLNAVGSSHLELHTDIAQYEALEESMYSCE